MKELENLLDHSINPDNGTLLIYYDEFEKEIKKLFSKLESERDEYKEELKRLKPDFAELILLSSKDSKRIKVLVKERDELKVKLGNANSQLVSAIKASPEIEQSLKLQQELQTLKDLCNKYFALEHQGQDSLSEEFEILELAKKTHQKP